MSPRGSFCHSSLAKRAGKELANGWAWQRVRESEEKRVLFSTLPPPPNPQDWQELACWVLLPFSPLSNSTNTFSSCQGLMEVWRGLWWSPKSLAPTPHLLLMGSCGSPCQGLRTWPPWQYTSAPKPGCLAALGGTLSAHALRQPPCCRLAPGPGGSTSAGWPANEQVSLAAKCVCMPVPLQKASFVAVTPPPLLDSPASFFSNSSVRKLQRRLQAASGIGCWSRIPAQALGWGRSGFQRLTAPVGVSPVVPVPLAKINSFSLRS